MKGIDPIWLTVITTVVAIDNWIGSGKVDLHHVFPDGWIPWIVGWTGFLGGILGFVVAGLTTIISNKPGILIGTPPSKPIVIIALVLGSLFALPGSAHAQAPRPRAAIGQPPDLIQKLKDDFTAKTGVQATGDLGFDLLRALDAKLLPDLQYALLLAKANNNKLTAGCWQAWIDVINTQQQAVKDAQGNDMPIPDPHVVTGFERIVDLRNMLQPESAFMMACSPVANLVKHDMIKFMGVVISGGAGLATLIPGL